MSLPDQDLMNRALLEAAKGGFAVRPNPLVGCAIETRDGQIISAHHEKYGSAHAERNAIDRALLMGLDLTGARIAITLEPCSHTGKTPPCVDLLLKHRWAEILIGTRDPNPKVNGQGIKKLEAAGFRVRVGVLEEPCFALNESWLKAQTLGRAHLTLKLATSLDGKFSANDGESKWITSLAARNFALAARSQFSAIISSGATVRADNPSLTARNEKGDALPQQPTAIILSMDPQFSLQNFKVEKHPGSAKLVKNLNNLQKFLVDCLNDGLFSMLLESGPTLAQQFLALNLVDEIHWYYESKILGGSLSKDFSEAFNGGKLPGLEFQIKDVKVLGPSSFLLKLTKDSMI